MPPRSGGALRAMARHILAEGQFRRPPDIWQAVLAWLYRHLSFRLGFSGGAWLSDVAFAVLLALAAGVMAALWRKGAFGRLRHPRVANGLVVTEAGRSMTPRDWLLEADRLAAAGLYREALRCRYRALVGDLAASGVLEEVPGRTTGDYERMVLARLPPAGGPFAKLTRLFEACWYGDVPSGQAEQSAFEAMAADVRGLAPGPGRARR